MNALSGDDSFKLYFLFCRSVSAIMASNLSSPNFSPVLFIGITSFLVSQVEGILLEVVLDHRADW